MITITVPTRRVHCFFFLLPPSSAAMETTRSRSIRLLPLELHKWTFVSRRCSLCIFSHLHSRRPLRKQDVFEAEVKWVTACLETSRDDRGWREGVRHRRLMGGGGVESSFSGSLFNSLSFFDLLWKEPWARVFTTEAPPRGSKSHGQLLAVTPTHWRVANVAPEKQRRRQCRCFFFHRLDFPHF